MNCTRKLRNICDLRNSFLVARGSCRGVRILLDLGEGGQVEGESLLGDKVGLGSTNSAWSSMSPQRLRYSTPTNSMHLRLRDQCQMK